MIRVQRIYSSENDVPGKRVLVERLWPRGFTKERAKLDLWMKDIAPSDDLRKWFNHEPVKWEGFKKRYFAELDKNTEVEKLIHLCSTNDVIFLFSSKEENMNSAVALKEYVEKKIRD